MSTLTSDTRVTGKFCRKCGSKIHNKARVYFETISKFSRQGYTCDRCWKSADAKASVVVIPESCKTSRHEAIHT